MFSRMIPSFFNAFCTQGYFLSYLLPLAIEWNLQHCGKSHRGPGLPGAFSNLMVRGRHKILRYTRLISPGTTRQLLCKIA
ncbi:hypothetical protein EMIT0196P_80212 [Pseudomonas chlororaphis]